MRIVLLILLLAGPALAVEPSEMLDDPALEARARAISKELRCVVCQNENIDDSNAGIASDIRILLRERITAGDSDSEAMQYIVDRYGEYVLLKPRFSGENLILWLAGPMLLLLGGVGALVFIKKHAKAPPEAGLSEDEQEKLARILQD